MCLAIPSKIISIKDKKIIIDELGNEKKVNGSLVRVEVGDYVILQNNIVVRKVNKKAAREIINLIKR